MKRICYWFDATTNWGLNRPSSRDCYPNY
jgi:hypothetical protein